MLFDSEYLFTMFRHDVCLHFYIQSKGAVRRTVTAPERLVRLWFSFCGHPYSVAHSGLSLLRGNCGFRVDNEGWYDEDCGVEE